MLLTSNILSVVYVTEWELNRIRSEDMYPHACVVLLTSRSQLQDTVRVVLMCNSLKNKEPNVKLELENRGKERRAKKKKVWCSAVRLQVEKN